MSLQDKLTHRVDITATGGINNYGEETAGATVAEVPCFIDGRFRRIAGEGGTLISIDFSILFMPDTDIGLSYVVTNGVDKDGNLLLERGEVIGLEDSNHPRKGRVVREAFIVRN